MQESSRPQEEPGAEPWSTLSSELLRVVVRKRKRTFKRIQRRASVMRMVSERLVVFVTGARSSASQRFGVDARGETSARVVGGLRCGTAAALLRPDRIQLKVWNEWYIVNNKANRLRKDDRRGAVTGGAQRRWRGPNRTVRRSSIRARVLTLDHRCIATGARRHIVTLFVRC
jgi:hypothetical protein